MHDSKQLLLATRPFAREQPWRSWWHLGSTIAALGIFVALACSETPWVLRLPFSVTAGLLLVRFFVLYHDHQHGSILRGSKLADAIMLLFGLLSLNPPSVWKRSHDHHHRNNSKTFGRNVGSYPLLTVDAYQALTTWERLRYAAARHPLTMLFGYLTVFLVWMCLVPLLANPRRHFDAGLSIILHVGLMGFGFDETDDLWLAGLIPFFVGSAVGAYLFFAQHNFPQARLQTGQKWDYVSAALQSSSFIRMGWLMRWFTGNIGYHHVHHLNFKIPFYRLPEAMKSIPELQTPLTTSLRPRDVISCLRLKLWDPLTEKLVTWPARRQPTPQAAGTTAE
jgi:omega-6 fatty acid desaturase (delta-12 desaturase)